MSFTQDTDRLRTAHIEVYEFPSNCVSEELELHFDSEPFSAKCLRIERRARSFLLKFSEQDVEKVLANPEQALFGEQENKIRLRLFSSRSLLVTSDRTLSDRLVKAYFNKKAGAVESCCPHLGDKQFIVRFTNAHDAERVSEDATHHITSTVTVRVELYDERISSQSERDPSVFGSADDLDSLESAGFTSLGALRPMPRRPMSSSRDEYNSLGSACFASPIPVKPTVVPRGTPLQGPRVGPSGTPIIGTRMGPTGTLIYGAKFEPGNLHLRENGMSPSPFETLRHDISSPFRPVSGSFNEFRATETPTLPQPKSATEGDRTVLAETTMSSSVLKKFVKSKSKGTLTKELGGGKFLVEYDTHEAAKTMVDKKVLQFMENKINVSFYVPDEKTDKLALEGNDTDQPTHIEVKKQTKRSPTDMHSLLTIHLDEVLGYEGHTPYEQSYDEQKHIFRFDLRPSEITKLMSTPQYLDEADKKNELIISRAFSGNQVIVQASQRADSKLSVAQLKATFGHSSAFSTSVEVISSDRNSYKLTFDSCSVAAKIVTMHRHKLRNGMVVTASFPDVYTESDSEASTEEEYEDDLTDDGTDEAVDAAADPPTARGSPLRTLLVSNILDFDEQTLYFWIKSALDVWPKSIQVSASEEEAIVKIPDGAELDARLRPAQWQEDFFLHGGPLKITELPATKCVQVICISDEPRATIEADTLEAYFSNERYTGVKDSSSLQSVKYKTTYNNLPVYVVTYTNSQDVESVLDCPSHRHLKWTFDVAEFNTDIGICGPKSLWMYKMVPREETGNAAAPMLHILDVADDDMENLRLLMSHRKRTNGGEIEKCWTTYNQSTGSTTAHIIYTNTDVAKRVYDSNQEDGIKLGNRTLELQLELPWLTEEHDDHKVQISGLGNDMDPEKLRCYLSALSSNVVTELLFDERQMRAVAVFKQHLEYGKFVERQSSIPLKGFPELKLSQAEKGQDLVATGSLYKEQIELQLENYLSQILRREVEVLADELPGTTNMWRITTEYEALPHILNCKRFVSQCESLKPYSQFLGLHMTNGALKKAENVANLISDPMMLSFLLRVPAGYQNFERHLLSLGMKLSEDGTISTMPVTNRQDERVALQNWRSLKPSLERFISENLLIYKTETLTQQIYEKVSTEMPRLVADQPLVTGTNAAGQSTGNVIAVVGERAAVGRFKSHLQQLISRFEVEIREATRVTKITIPNVLECQVKYLQSGHHFFDEMKQRHNLESISCDATKRVIVIEGIPRCIDAAQMEMLDLLRRIAESKVSVNRKAAFLTVFKTESAVQAIQQEFLTNAISALWIVENKTVSVYAESKKVSLAAMDCINSVVWEERYPASHSFDELERRLLQSDIWREKRASMQQLYQPLEIQEQENQTKLVMAGLKHFKPNVLEDIPHFFETNVKRTYVFNGVPDRIMFLSKRGRELCKELEVKHDVTLKTNDVFPRIEISGTKRAITNCKSALQAVHDSICRELYTIETPAMIQYITEDYDVLETVGLKSRCFLVPHKEDVLVEEETSFSNRNEAAGVRCSVLMSNGSQCLVQRVDITAMRCDAIVNAANGDLQHVGGLALAIVRKGGSSIQQECTDYVRRHGQLMEGQVFTSSAGSLNCKKIIHAVGPRWNHGRSQEERTLYTCIDNCLEEADRLKLQSIAIPPISTGIFAYPLNQAVATIVEAVHDRDKRGETLPQQIIFTDNKEDSLMLFEKELMSRYKKSESISIPSLSAKSYNPVKGIGINYTINGRVISVANGLAIEIKHDDISTCQEDSMVNSVGQDMTLSSGKASKAISVKAGPQLQAACKGLAPINSGEVKETSGFNLPCKKVLHCACPSWNGPQTVQFLKKIVTSCLKQAASNQHQSIAFPALGTGILSYPVGEVSKGMIEAIIEFSSRHPRSSLKLVRIVIFPSNSQAVQGFDTELQRLAGGAGIVSGVVHKRDLRPDSVSTSVLRRDLRPQEATVGDTKDAVKGQVTVNDTTIRVLQGDIASHKADVIVNSTDKRLSMGGMVARAIMAKAGQVVQDEVYAMSLSHKKPTDGIWVSDAGKLEAHRILHIDSDLPQRMFDNWARMISNCLKRCEKLNLRTIAFPALATGNMRLPAKEMAVAISKAAVTYLNDHPKSSLTLVDVVVFQPDMVQDFVVSMEKAFEKKDPWWARLKVKITRRWASRNVTGGNARSHDEIPPMSTPEHIASLELDIYGHKAENIKECKRELQKTLDKVMETLIWRDTPGYSEDRANIPKLTSTQTNKLYAEADRLNVTLEINAKLCDIRLVGLQKSVTCMSHIVAHELQTVERKIHEKKEEHLVAKTTEWMYEDETGSWVKFDPGVNKALEEVYEADPQGTHKYTTRQGLVTFDLGRKTGVDSFNNTFKIQRKDLFQQQVSAVPKDWQPPHDTYTEYALVPATPEYLKVEQAFKAGGAQNAVLQITRVQNPTLYQQYVILRKDVAKRLGKPEDQVERTPLWHGTDEDTVSKITAGKFDRGLSGANGTYGHGTYFATTSSYSVGYAKLNAKGHKYMIMTRVVVGDYCAGQSGLKAAPYKPNNKVQQYDSVVNNIQNPTMFIVFHDASAYPEYIVKFQ